jgi:hypothetical protein
VIGPDGEACEPCCSGTKQASRPKLGIRERDREKSRKVGAHAGKGQEPFPGAHDRGQDRGKGEGGIKKILQGPEAYACVLPVLDEPVEILEKPPESGTRREKKRKATGLIEHQASPCAVKGEGVGKKDIGEPKRRERVGLKAWNQGKRLQARIQAQRPMVAPSPPHQGKIRNRPMEGVQTPGFRTPRRIKGVIHTAIKRV